MRLIILLFLVTLSMSTCSFHFNWVFSRSSSWPVCLLFEQVGYERLNGLFYITFIISGKIVFPPPNVPTSDVTWRELDQSCYECQPWGWTICFIIWTSRSWRVLWRCFQRRMMMTLRECSSHTVMAPTCPQRLNEDSSRGELLFSYGYGANMPTTAKRRLKQRWVECSSLAAAQFSR